MNSIKKSLLGILLSGIGCVSEPAMPVIQLSDRALYVNKDPSYHYLVYKNKNDGEKDLVNLTVTADSEEAWMFDKKENSWLEFGTHETDTCAYLDRKIASLTSEPSRYIFYHIHLSNKDAKEELSKLDELEKKLSNSLYEETTPASLKDNIRDSIIMLADKRIFTLASSLSGAFPSRRDLSNCLVMPISVASEFGVVDCSLYEGKLEDMQTLTSNYDPVLGTYFMIRGVYTDEWISLKNYSPENVIQAMVTKINRETNGKLKLNFRQFTPDKTLPSPSSPPLTSSRNRA